MVVELIGITLASALTLASPPASAGAPQDSVRGASPTATPASTPGAPPPAAGPAASSGSGGERPSSAPREGAASGSASATPTAASGAAAPSFPPPTITPLVARRRLRASLRVGTTAFDSVQVAGDLPARIEGLGFEALRAEGIMTAINAEYVVEIVVAPLGDESAGYVSTLVVYHGDEEVPGSRRRRKCELCLEDELLHQIKDELDILAPLIKDHAEPPVEPEAPPPPPEEPEVVAPPPLVVPPPRVEPEIERRGLGKLGRAGIGAVILGAVSLGAGSGLLVLGERSGRDLKAPSIALFGVGGVAVISGVGLLVVDKEVRQPRASVAPTVTRSGAGLLVVGRF